MANEGMSDKDKEMLRRRLKARRLFLDMTYQDLADKTGISKSTLQRYETGGIKNLPYDKIFKLSEALEVSPKYFTDLSNDYTGESNLIVMCPENHRKLHQAHIEGFEKKAIGIITPSLIYHGYTVEQRSHGSVGDLVAVKGNQVWHIDFLYSRDVNKYPTGMGMGRQQLLLRFGRLAVYDKPIAKYSIVVESREIAEHLSQIKPVNLNIKTSLIVLENDGYEEIPLN